MPKSEKVKRYVIGHDLHFPKVNWPTWDCMMELVSDIKPDGFIWGGDQFDNEEISHHNSNKPYYKTKGSYLRNQTGFDDKCLTPLEQHLAKGAEKVYIIGNHCHWSFQFVEEHPEFEGLVDQPSALRLVERGWEIIELGHAKEIGDLTVIHGEVLTGCGNQAGAYPSKKAVEIYGTNVLAGHTHAPQSFTKISPVNHRRKHMAWIAPILGDCNPAYLRNRATAWLNGFTVVEVMPSGAFNCFPVIVTDGQCSYGGKVYGIKRRAK